MMFSKRIWQAAVRIVAVAWLCSVLKAEPIKQLRPTGYVNDFAGVIDAASAEEIGRLCEQVDRKTKAQIAVVTIHTLDGADVESYALELYKVWGIGPKSDNRGVLILLAVNEHRYRIEVGYGLEPILPDGKVGGFGREAVPLLQQNKYGVALTLMTRRVAEVISEDTHVQLEEGAPIAVPQSPPRERASPDWGIFVVIGVLLLSLAFVVRLGGWGLIWFFFSSFLDGGGRSSRSGWGGGGGFGSGGGFGGFGGGISGGGGASGSW